MIEFNLRAECGDYVKLILLFLVNDKGCDTREMENFIFTLSIRIICLFEIFFKVSIFVPTSKIARICRLNCFANINLLFCLTWIIVSSFSFVKLRFFQCSSEFKETVILEQLCLSFLLYVLASSQIIYKWSHSFCLFI